MTIMPKAILFDLDGTLLDTAPEFTHCLNLLLAQEDKQQITLQQLRRIVTFGAKGMIEFGFSIDEQAPEFYHLQQRLLEIYSQHLGSKTEFFPGIANILRTIMQKGIKWGIVTNKPGAYTVPLVEKFKPLNEATCVISGDTLSTQKPDPAPLLHACQMLKIQPQHCWYVGDAITDIQAGHRAGMRCAIANYGYIPQDEDPLDWQADCNLSTAHDIASLVLGH